MGVGGRESDLEESEKAEGEEAPPEMTKHGWAHDDGRKLGVADLHFVAMEAAFPYRVRKFIREHPEYRKVEWGRLAAIEAYGMLSGWVKYYEYGRILSAIFTDVTEGGELTEVARTWKRGELAAFMKKNFPKIAKTDIDGKVWRWR